MAEARRVRPSEDVAKALASHAPWRPPSFSPSDVSAIQALWRGEAAPHQQRRALDFLIEMSRNDGAFYFPGEAGRRDTDFALGRAFVGEQLITLIKMKLKRGEEQP